MSIFNFGIIHYLIKSFDILRREGPVTLSKAFIKFILNLLDPGCYRQFKFYTWTNHLQNRIRYDAPPNPYKTINIRPSEIEYRLSKDDKDDWLIAPPEHRGIGRIVGGEWDKTRYRMRVDERPIIAGIREKFVEGKNWKETQYYHWLRERLESESKYQSRGFDSLEHYCQERFKEYERLYEEIKNEGYVENHQGTRRNPGGSSYPVRDTLEVLVCIDRNGRIYLTDGHHRFAIARVLGLEIPAHVICRHNQWQEFRDEVYHNGLSKEQNELRDHPDLQDIIN